MELRVVGSGCRVARLGIRVLGLKLRVQDLVWF